MRLLDCNDHKRCESCPWNDDGKAFRVRQEYCPWISLQPKEHVEKVKHKLNPIKAGKRR
jgi:hypothetical protein